MPVLPPESPLIGRDELLDTLLAGLRMRNSPTQLIVGPEGSGKTAIASGLAKKLHEVQTGPLAGYTISLLTAEEILQAESASGLVVEAVEKAGPLSVLFIDDLDAATLIGSELGTRTDLLVALRTAINRPDRHLILTISHPYAEKLQRVYPEFVDELQLVDLPPLSAESLQLIANRQAKKLAWFHRVEIDDDVVATACQAPSTQDRLSHPALALRRLDRAAATAAHNGLSNAVMGPTEPQLRFDQVAVAQGMAGRVIMLNERRNPGDGAPGHQGVDLIGALVGVDGLGVAEDLGHLVVHGDAVAAEDAPAQRHGLAHALGDEGLGHGGVFVAGGAGVLHLRQPDHHAHRGLRVGEHGDELFLNELETGDRLAELVALHGIAAGGVERGQLDAHGLPAHRGPGGLEDLVGVAEAVGVRQFVEVGHDDVLQDNIGILDSAQGNAIFN